jgi:hypothetical protein
MNPEHPRQMDGDHGQSECAGHQGMRELMNRDEEADPEKQPDQEGARPERPALAPAQVPIADVGGP